jgi:NAD(P)-dependent dehydrogenase (short-subunit alcohol dehydrogenase family)
VFAISRNIDTLKNIDLKGKKLVPLKCDITNVKQLERAIATINEKCKSIDYLINNAGAIINKPFNQILDQDIDNVFNTNFKAPFLLIKLLFPLLQSSKNAHIVNISSMGGFQGTAKFSGLSAYSSSKAALTCLTECLAEEFKTTTVKINALCLGAVDTEMLNTAFPDYKAPINAIQIAEFIHYFTCNSQRYMNGKIIPVALSTP